MTFGRPDRARSASRGPGSRPWRAWLWIALALTAGCGEGPAGNAAAPREAAPAPRSAPAAEASRPADPSGPVYYSYVEAGGTLRFVARLEDVPEAERPKAKAIRGSAAPAAARSAWGSGKSGRKPGSAALVEPPPPPHAEGQAVVVYTTSWCPWCRRTLAFLDARHVRYVNKDIEKNPAWRSELVEKTGSASVPMVEIDGQRIDGFDQAAMERLL